MPPRVLEDLGAAGFEVEIVAGPSGDLGHSHAIRVLPDGAFEVGSDPRADGGALAS